MDDLVHPRRHFFLLSLPSYSMIFRFAPSYYISCFFNIRDSSCLKILWSAVGSASWVIRKTRHYFLEGLLNAKEERTLTHSEAEEVPLLLYSSPTGPGVDSVLVHPLRYESRCLFPGQSLHWGFGLQIRNRGQVAPLSQTSSPRETLASMSSTTTAGMSYMRNGHRSSVSPVAWIIDTFYLSRISLLMYSTHY